MRRYIEEKGIKIKMEERRSGRHDRRKSERRKREIHCIQCGKELTYYNGDKPQDKETFWCDSCQQMYVLVSQHMEIPYLSKLHLWSNKKRIKECDDIKVEEIEK
jgi:transcription elongation factor Elf1